MTDNYLPSLHWDPDHQQWIPKRGFTTVELPAEVDPNVLPKPAYQIGERVRLSWYGTTPWEGEIRGIQIAGGESDPFNSNDASRVARIYHICVPIIYYSWLFRFFE